MSQNSVIHIDAGMTVKNGRYLLNQAKKKASKQEQILLILTHHHSDHIFGMGVFKEKGAEIISHKNLQAFLSHRTMPLFRPVLDTYNPFIVELMVKRFSYDKAQAEKTLGDVKLSLLTRFFQKIWSSK